MPLRVLLLEDSVDDAELVLREFQRSGLSKEWLRVGTKKEFQEALQNQPWDLVLSDYHLPGFDGLEALRIFQLSGLDIPFVMVSGVLGEEAAVAAMKAGAHDVVLKDNLVRLGHVVERELRDAESRREQLRDKAALWESEARYRALFHQSPLPIRVEDMSEVKHCLDAIQRSGVQDFRAFFETHPGVVVQCAEVVKITEVNQASLEFFASEDPERAATSLASIFCEETWPVFREELVALASGRTAFESEVVVQLPRGEKRILSLKLSVCPGFEDTLARVLVSFLDITHLKETEDSLRQSQVHLEKALKIAQMGSWEWDLSTNRRTWSRQLRSIFGLEAREPPPDYDGYIQLIHPDDRPHVLGLVEEAIERGPSLDLEYRIQLATGETRHIHELAEVIRDAGGRPRRFWGIAQDVTEQHRMESDLRDLEKLTAKGQMSAYIAHEINNPLAGIKNAFLLLEEAIPREHPHWHYAGLIKREIDRIANIIRTMYHVYRPSSLEVRDISLSEAFEDIASLMIPKCRAQGVELTLDLEDARLKVHANEGMLRQVLFNLVQNATEASPRDSVIVLGARAGLEDVLITILDQGAGIPPELSNRIFVAGFTTKHDPGAAGLGLGLSTCKSIVESMKGNLDFVSGEGGTRFQVRLPAGVPQLRESEKEDS